MAQSFILEILQYKYFYTLLYFSWLPPRARVSRAIGYFAEHDIDWWHRSIILLHRFWERGAWREKLCESWVNFVLSEARSEEANFGKTKQKSKVCWKCQFSMTMSFQCWIDCIVETSTTRLYNGPLDAGGSIEEIKLYNVMYFMSIMANSGGKSDQCPLIIMVVGI